MEVNAHARFLHITPRKVRTVCDLVRKKEASQAVQILKLTPKRGARELVRVLQSALANGKNRTTPESVWTVKNIQVNDGPRMKRLRSAPMGRAMQIKKRMSHISVTLESSATEGKR